MWPAKRQLLTTPAPFARVRQEPVGWAVVLPMPTKRQFSKRTFSAPSSEMPPVEKPWIVRSRKTQFVAAAVATRKSVSLAPTALGRRQASSGGSWRTPSIHWGELSSHLLSSVWSPVTMVGLAGSAEPASVTSLAGVKAAPAVKWPCVER